jgi:hypothetical protein
MTSSMTVEAETRKTGVASVSRSRERGGTFAASELARQEIRPEHDGDRGQHERQVQRPLRPPHRGVDQRDVIPDQRRGSCS